MSARNAATLMVKGAGLYLLLQTVGYLPLSLTAVGGASGDWTAGSRALLFVSGTLLLMGLGLFLIFRSHFVAPWIMAGTEEESAAGVGSQQRQALLFSAVGVWFLGSAGPSLLHTVLLLFYSGLPRSGWPAYALSLVRVIAEFGIGLGLFLRAPGLAAFWHRLQGYRATRMGRL